MWPPCLGDIVFQVSEEVTETIRDVEWSGSARYSTHQRHNMNALTEYTGIDPDTMKFTITLTRELGVDVVAEIVKIWNLERGGEAARLVIGDKPYGKYRWTVQKHSAKYVAHDKKGNPVCAEVALELQEYLKA
ncbi:phage tail protein [Oscillospiraceae bacterium 42-9]